MSTDIAVDQTLLGSLLETAAEPEVLCRAYVLMWVAASDGALSDDEFARLAEYFAQSPDYEARRDALAALVRRNDTASHIVACQYLQAELSRAQQYLLLERAVAIAMTDPPLAESSNHVLRLLADLFSLGASQLDGVFLKVTGDNLPEPGDPSSPDWWQGRDHGARAGHASHFQNYSPETLSDGQAREVLGVAKDASAQEIKEAYRKLVHRYHPDRYQPGNGVSPDNAEHMFRLIRHAYEVLKP